MPRFKFPLQRLLEHRQRQEQDKQRDVAHIEHLRLALEQKIRTQHNLIEHAKQDLRHVLHPVGTESATDVNMVDLRAARLQAGASMRCLQHSQHLAIQLAGVLKHLQSARNALLEATTARKAVDLLRDKALAAWKHDEDRRETYELDDISASRFERNRLEHSGKPA